MVPTEGARDLFGTLRARGQSCDEYDLSSFWKENWFSSCETSAEKWNSGREQEERKKRGEWKLY